MAVIDAHKRIDAYRTRVTGREAHSSMPDLGVNAISAAAALIGELERIGAGIAARQHDKRFEPPYSTVSVGTIEGGTAHNIVPKTCEFQWHVRSLPSVEPSEAPRDLAAFAETTLLPKMRQVTKEAAIDTESEGSVPAFVAAPGSEAVALALALTGADRHRGRVLRHGSRTVRGGWRAGGDLRSRQYRARACGRRICRHHAARSLHGISRWPRR